MNQPTPQEARVQLAATQTHSLSSPRDRKVHALYAVFVGVVIGLHVATGPVIGNGAYALLGLVVIGILLIGTIWVGRAARTVPRRVRVLSWVGFVTSFLVGLWIVTPWLNLSAQTDPITWTMVLGGAAITATPTLIAAAVIALGRK